MRDQYVGDVSDVVKCSFFRALTGNDRLLGIAWYYLPIHDGRPDGRHTEWQTEPEWERLDPQLHKELLRLEDRKISSLQAAAIWPTGTKFYDQPVPSMSAREAWALQKRICLNEANIVFLDPDNGLGEKSSKHASLSEIRLLRKPGRSIVLITFPGRNLPHEHLLKSLHERLQFEAGAEKVITLRTNVSVPSIKRPRYFVQRQRWLTVVDPDSDLILRAKTFADALATIPRVKVVLVET